ncbi:hypothetical protein M440DRAFT_1391153 [Trichoderma longibrachiatum ATCC 18648]|uniref:Uncharacterized protein n=1 Tax=Trichoderma longibrachiatum ATCC 18648 TaxID=983965 RepID=A0A2T4C8Q7_TRILO|nr:hypothetical protein M440DRAFT_1391153 [Trichoderma longibrachiatum ATCC 18648]
MAREPRLDVASLPAVLPATPWNRASSVLELDKLITYMHGIVCGSIAPESCVCIRGAVSSYLSTCPAGTTCPEAQPSTGEGCRGHAMRWRTLQGSNGRCGVLYLVLPLMYTVYPEEISRGAEFRIALDKATSAPAVMAEDEDEEKEIMKQYATDSMCINPDTVICDRNEGMD